MRPAPVVRRSKLDGRPRPAAQTGEQRSHETGVEPVGVRGWLRRLRGRPAAPNMKQRLLAVYLRNLVP